MRSLLCALALVGLGLAGAAAAEDKPPPRIYRWVDENGIAHYTTDPDRIPKSLLQRFGLPAQPLAPESLDPGAPRPSPTHSGGPDAWAGQEKRPEPAPSAHPEPALGAPGPASPAATASAPAAAPGDRLAQLELQIAELSAAIAADEDTLASYISDPSKGDAIELGDQPQFREITLRIPKRLQELEALRRERDALRGAPASDGRSGKTD